MPHYLNVRTAFLTSSLLLSVCVLIFGSLVSTTIFADSDTFAVLKNPPPQCTSSALTNEQIRPLYSITKNFSAAAFSSCEWLTPHHLVVNVTPEGPKINPSPWYAFDIKPLPPSSLANPTKPENSPQPDSSVPLTITLDYGEFKHRYAPKMFNQQGWQLVPVPTAAQHRRNNTKQQTQYTFAVVVNNPKIRIAAQPIIDAKGYDRWVNLLTSQLPNLQQSSIGKSVEQRDINMLSYITDPTKPFIILIGRQHPPELTGAMAMLSFVPELLADTDLAKTFRKQFNMLIFPLVNPDGVHHGYWRHNMQATDLNRDWGPFTQPETSAVSAQINALTAQSEVWTMLDFHSTYRDILYTHSDNATQILPTLAKDWLAKINADGPIIFQRKSSHNPKLATTKTYFYERYNSPAITYELNDTSSPEDIALSSSRSAQHFMQLLLDYQTRTYQQQGTE